MEEDDYNVNNYTDNELYDVLELVNPTDSVLEAKIIQMINIYKSVDSSYGKKLVDFFMNIYQRFFDVPSEHFETIEGYENIESSRYDKTQKKFIENTNAPSGIAYETDLNNVNAKTDWYKEENSALPSQLQNVKSSKDPTTNKWNTNQMQITNIQNDPTLKVEFKETTKKLNKESNMQVQQLDYAKGVLNPLLKQTIKRIISIDSQYRETKDLLSTEFTFNLSEPLRDVVALRLYSVQIPFTWYTVGNNYGANYVYLKGNAPGIDTGDFDYQIEIAPGNYTNQTLVDEIQSQIPIVRSLYTDISFGLTSISYDPNACKSTFIIDIKNLYNESDYQLIFTDEPGLNKYPLLSDPNTTTNPDDQYRYSTTHATSTLSAYLGFDNQSYRINTIYSNPNTMDNSTYTNSKIYTINSTNNSFTISREVANGTKIEDDIIISLPENVYSGKGIVDAINSILSTHTRLDNTLSKILRKQVTDPNKDSNYTYSYGSYYYEMIIYFNKKTDIFANVSGLTTYIAFPNENDIWTGTNSLLKFKSKKEYTNIIIAESESHQTDYPITSNPYIVLKCIKTGFDTLNLYDPSNNTHGIPPELSNDFVVDISNYNINNGYNFTSYINEIHTKLQVLNSSTKAYDTSIFLNDVSYNSFTNKVFFTFDINIQFTQNSYEITFGNIFTSLGFSNTPRIDLSSQIVGTKLNFTSYTVTTNEVLATIYPKTTTKNYNDSPWIIKYTGTNTTYTIFEDLKNFIKGQFDNFMLIETNGNITPITLNIEYNTETIDNDTQTTTTLNFNIIRILTERDFDVYFYDANGDTPSSWTKNLFFNAYYNLNSIYNPSISETSITINSNSQIAGYTFYMDKDMTFTLSAITPGAYSSGGENNQVITVPKPVSGNLYTRQEILNIINAQFDSSPLTSGSKIEYFTAEEPNPTNKQYIRIKIKINKMFTSSDYKMVFYDQFSFVKCFSGTKSVRNVTWDSTLGWILGFRSFTEYEFNNKIEYPKNKYSNISNVVTLISDTTMTTNIYDYFLIILDDYTQSHLNDGLVTIIPKDMSIPLPSYAQTKTCSTTGNVIVTNSSGTTNNLTANQLYAANTILNQAKMAKKSYSTGPYIQDVFGLIPLKLGIAAGQTYVEFGGTLQNQERVYFGPVNISRMSIKLINDRGEPVDLNGANWSFSFICEQIYNLNERSN
jgi:hypothetical protein